MDENAPLSASCVASETKNVKQTGGALDAARKENKRPTRRGSKAKASLTKKTKPLAKQTAEQAAPAKAESAPFQPVQKSVYNRLPRNLKIKAGKLDEINSFYEKVWNALLTSDGILPESGLLASLGESEPTKLKVLQGLTVVRKTKDGWTLP